MAKKLFRKGAKQPVQANPPAPVSEEDKFRSPFNDQREDAPDNWARPVAAPAPEQTGASAPVEETQAAPLSDWQESGYLMQDTAADHAVPLDESNDEGYVTSDTVDWHDDPFQDSAVDPRLRTDRSDNLINHTGPFFADPNSTGGQTGAQPAVAGAQTQPYHGSGRAGSRVWLWVSLIVVVLVIAGSVIYSTALRITSIQVQGNIRISDEEIIRLSGIRLGSNVLTLDDDSIRAGIQSNNYLVYNGITRVSPRDIVISVREREAAAYISYCGLIYVIDNRGNSLAESDDTEHVPMLIRVEGLEIRKAPMGERLIPVSEERLDLYVNIMLELKAMKAQDKVSELYVSDMDNLYIGLKDGYSVHLGSKADLHAKLRAMLLTLDELNARSAGPGTIDVSSPASPNYIPENNPSV